MYFMTKVFITACIIAIASELARRYTLWSALLVSLPLTSILAFIWVYYETRNVEKIIALSYSIFWLVLPSLLFFLIFPLLLKQGMAFAWAMVASIGAMACFYSAGIWVHKFFMS